MQKMSACDEIMTACAINPFQPRWNSLSAVVARKISRSSSSSSMSVAACSVRFDDATHEQGARAPMEHHTFRPPSPISGQQVRKSTGRGQFSLGAARPCPLSQPSPFAAVCAHSRSPANAFLVGSWLWSRLPLRRGAKSCGNQTSALQVLLAPGTMTLFHRISCVLIKSLLVANALEPLSERIERKQGMQSTCRMYSADIVHVSEFPCGIKAERARVFPTLLQGASSNHPPCSSPSASHAFVHPVPWFF